MSPYARQAKAMPMKAAIDQWLKSFNLQTKFNETYLVAFWERMMGATIASRTKQLYVRNKILYLFIESAPLRNELALAKTKLIDLLNKEVGENVIEDIVLL